MPDEDRSSLNAAAQSVENVQSFFVSNFTKADWIALFGSIAAFLAFLGWMMDKVADASVGDVKTEIALVKASVEATETNLKAAFDAHTKKVDDIVDGALTQRTDEIARSMMEMFGDTNAVVVRVANVPTDVPVVMAALQDFSAKYSDGTTLATFGDKAVFETVVNGMVDAKARSLQGMIETLHDYPSVQTNIMFVDPEKLGTLRARFLSEKASGQN